MSREEWASQVRKLENRDKEITQEYDAKVKELEGTYSQQKDQWSQERDDARGDVIADVPGGTDRLEYAQRTLEALEKGHGKKLGDLEHEYELDKSANQVELQELRANAPLVEVAIQNMDTLIEIAKSGYEVVGKGELPPIDVGGEMGWEVIKDATRNAYDRAELLVDNILEKFKGDPMTPREEKLEHWIDQAQNKFDDKYKDAPAKERESMQEKLDQNFDLLRAALERQQERQQERKIDDDPPFGP